MKKIFASVILESNINKPLDYSIPAKLHLKIKEKMLVEVPLRGRMKKGLIIAIKNTTNIKNVLDINRIVYDKVISKDLFNLAIWMTKYYCCPFSKILKCIIPSGFRKEVSCKYQILLSTNKTKKELLEIFNNLTKKNPKQAKIIEYFLKGKRKIFLSELINATKLTKSPILTLIKKKFLIEKKVLINEIDIINNFEYFSTSKKPLNPSQLKTFKKIEKSLVNNVFETHLIYGVTGSGKTEIYLQAIEKALELDKSSIMLVPEISLTTQTIERFKARFSEKIAVYHHRCSLGEKNYIWTNVLKGNIKIIIGTRSAIFCPIKNLGLIIIDEEHDPSYKQTSKMPAYNAKHLAIMRAKFTNSTVVLASATPSVESFYHAKNNKFILSALPNRVNNFEMAKVEIIDMKKELRKSNSYFSDDLLEEIKNRYKKGEQIILFLNRRGYHTSLHCLNCSYIFKCKHCDITLAFHKKENTLSCHLCGRTISIVKKCPNCQSHEYIKYKGFGTEQVQSVLKAIFPDIRILRVDRDTTSSKDSFETLFKQFKAGKADVLIGTQMIIKGLHYPSVTLVGILNTDAALSIPDFRSSEKVFQLITQACGRSGRAELKGKVIIQTYISKNETIKHASEQDYLKFYENEIENRRIFDYPPFCQMIKIAFLSTHENKAKETASNFRKILINNISNKYKVHLVLPSGRAKIKDIYKYQFIIRGKNILSLCEKIAILKNDFKCPGQVTFFIDVDPVDIYF